MLLPTYLLALSQMAPAGLPVNAALITVADAAQASTAVNGDLSAAIGSGEVIIGDRGKGEYSIIWEIAYEDLTGPIELAHIHGPAARGENAGVLVDLLGPNGTNDQGVLSGFFDTSDIDLVNAIRTGNSYVNLHTAANVGGEIRGQIESPISFVVEAVLDPDQATNPVNAPGAAGEGFVRYDDRTDEMSWQVAYQGLTGAPISAHIHAPADFGASAGVAVPLDHTTAPIVGSASAVASADIAHIMAGLSYFNIHTSAHTSGEIRGQLLPILFGSNFELPPSALPPIGGCSDDGFEPNDSVAEATNTTSPFVAFDLQICSGNDDFFTIEAAAGETLEVDAIFAHNQGDLDVRILDASENIVASSESSTDNESLTYNIPLELPGTYYVQVFGVQGDENSYDLDIELTRP